MLEVKFTFLNFGYIKVINKNFFLFIQAKGV